MVQFLFLFSTIANELKRSKNVLLPCLILIVIIGSTGCIKEEQAKSIVVLDSNTSNDLLKLTQFGETTKIVGGQTWYAGEILSYKNGIITNQFSNDITFLNVRYDTTQNRFVGIGLNGSYYEFDDSISMFSNGNFQVIRDIYFGEKYNILSGGKSYALGYLSKLNKDKTIHTITEIPYEFRAIDKIGSNLYAVGFGIIATSADDGDSWKKTELVDDFFLSIVKTSGKTSYIVGQENSIYTTEDYGVNWDKSFAPRKEQVNHARFINGKLHLFCDGGIIKVLSNEKNWTIYKIGDLDLNDGTSVNDGILVIGESGFVAIVNLE